MPESLEERRRRLIYRSLYTGMKETDVLLGPFAQQHLPEFSSTELDQYEQLLREPDPDILDWVSGRQEVPDAHDHDVMKLLKDFNKSR